MSLDSIITQAREHEYRARTQTDKAMAGVTLPTFKCTRCGGYRPIKGRKRRAGKYVCAPCIAKENSNE